MKSILSMSLSVLLPFIGVVVSAENIPLENENVEQSVFQYDKSEIRKRCSKLRDMMYLSEPSRKHREGTLLVGLCSKLFSSVGEENPTPTSASASASPNVAQTNMEDETTSCGSFEKRQEDYRGSIAVTKTGKPCIAWSETDWYDGYKSNFANTSIVNGNACRNPEGESEQAWCFYGRYDWDYCDVPYCRSDLLTSATE